jgi:hypothetical protein
MNSPNARGRVRKLLLLGLLLGGACQSRTVEEPAPVPAPVAVASGARSALESFLASVRAGDLQTMSEVWGDKNGPVRDSKVFSREEMEQREVYLIRCLKHDKARILGDAAAPNGERAFQVELTRGTTVRVTDFFLTKAPERWYVRSANMEPVRDLCSTK